MRSLRLLAIAALFAGAADAVRPVQFLPEGAIALAATSDPSGNVYAGGSLGEHAFVAKLGAGSVEWIYTSSGSGPESISSLAAGPDGAIYAAGTNTLANSPRAFALKLARDGRLNYRTTIGGATTSASAIAVNKRGEALVSGQFTDGETPAITATAGAVGRDTAGNTSFLVKLDANGAKILVAIRGFGQGPVAYDDNGNLYVAGTVWGAADMGPTAGAFQTTHDFRMCAGSGTLQIACSYQYAAKISADGTKLLYATYVAGSYGAVPAGLAVDAAGNATIAGTTHSSDYPVTQGAYQTGYRVTDAATATGPHGAVTPPPATGYATKVNADGTGLVWSTYFSGTGSESVTGLQVDSQGRIVITGLAGSRDLPGAQTVPAECQPSLGDETAYVAQLSADGARLVASRYVYGLDLRRSGPALALRADWTPAAAAGETAAEIDLTATPPLACVTDPANRARIVEAAPGQLITLYGEDFATEEAAVTVDGAAARLLYASARQINAQIPWEAAEGTVVEIAARLSGGGAGSRQARIVRRAPSVFLDVDQAARTPRAVSCHGTTYSPAYPPVARNEDGGLNTCETPAEPGSVVTLYWNGLGTKTAEARLEYPQAGEILVLEPDPDSPAGVWRMRVRVAAGAQSVLLAPLIDGASIRNGFLPIWVRAQ